MFSFASSVSSRMTSQRWFRSREYLDVAVNLLNSAINMAVSAIQSASCISSPSPLCSPPIQGKALSTITGISISLLLIAMGYAVSDDCRAEENQSWSCTRKEALITMISTLVSSGVSIIAQPTEPYISLGAAALGSGSGYGVGKLLTWGGFFCKPSEPNPDGDPLINGHDIQHLPTYGAV
jgi:hypothetical protein